MIESALFPYSVAVEEASFNRIRLKEPHHQLLTMFETNRSHWKLNWVSILILCQSMGGRGEDREGAFWWWLVVRWDWIEHNVTFELLRFVTWFSPHDFDCSRTRSTTWRFPARIMIGKKKIDEKKERKKKWGTYYYNIYGVIIRLCCFTSWNSFLFYSLRIFVSIWCSDVNQTWNGIDELDKMSPLEPGEGDGGEEWKEKVENDW